MGQFTSFFDLATANTGLHYDYCFISKGTEDRAYTIIERYSETILADNFLLFDSRRKTESFSASENERYNRINNILSAQSGTNIQIISVEDSKLGVVLSAKKIKSISRAAVDISSMNFWEIGDILYYLVRILQVDYLDVFYTEPGIYSYLEDDITKYKHKEIKVSYNYPPNYLSTKTTQENEIFVAELGFQRNVLKLMKDLYEVSDWYSINGFPSYYPKAKDISLANNSDYLSDVAISHRFSSEANNPFICYNTLCDIKAASGDSFMTICPLGSKPMILGTCLYVLKHQADTRIVYPYDEYVVTETNGIGRTFCYHIDSKHFN